MEESVLVSVVVDQTVFSIDKPYDYFVPSELQAKAKLGCRVTVPFGNGNRKKQGLIIGFSDNGMTEKTKMICSVVDENPILNEELLKLVEYIKEYNLCTWYDAVKCILPPGINYKFVSYYSVCDETVESDIRKLPENEMHIARYLYETKMEITADKLWDNLSIEENQLALSKLLRKGILKKRDEAVRKTRNATLKMVRISQNEDINFTEKQKKVLNLLKDMKTTSAKELCYFAGVTEAVLSGLEKKGAIEFYAKEYYRRPYNISPVNKTEIILTSEQQNAYNKLLDISESGKPEAVLLYGITGSGKTQVFLKLCQSVLKKGKGIIVMVPEISLTPQTLSIFNSMFGDDIAVFHSAMSQGQRLDEWRRVNDGKARIAIGTRTAVFAPIKNLGLIIMDEEQGRKLAAEAGAGAIWVYEDGRVEATQDVIPLLKERGGATSQR
ncbi:MAG: DEAD/DEAH box helicase family protein, partial [Oscillospiraceae bacterium]